MSVKNSKCLVVDASILRAAKKANAIHPTPIRCRDFLEEIFRLGHTVVITPEIKQEWNKHIRSDFAKDWYFRMLSRGRFRVVKQTVVNDDLRYKIMIVVPNDAKQAVEKDLRLIEGALHADEIVSSLDEKMRGHFKRVAIKVDEIASILWVNPTNDDEDCIIWLRQSAPADDFRMLGHQDS